MSAGGLRATLGLIVRGAWVQHKGRLACSVLAIGLGVALGVTVHLINHSAIAEFARAARALTGEADLSVRGTQEGFSETLYPLLARLPEVTIASPLLELDARLAGTGETLRIVGIDPFRALTLQPELLGDGARHVLKLLRADSVLLTVAAAERLGIAEDDRLRIALGRRTLELRVIGRIAGIDAQHQARAIMDIASAQWRFERLGQLTRIDLRLAAGSELGAVRAKVDALLPPGVHAIPAQAEVAHGVELSRGYRTNLNMLALVALFTGGFLVFSTQALSVLRRRSHFALLRALGMTRGALTRVLLAEAALVGAGGSLLGVLLGIAAARVALTRFGADLGAGYFGGVTTPLHIEPLSMVGFFGLGVLACMLGGLGPAREAARAAPASALRAGDEQRALGRVRRVGPGVAVMGAGAAIAFLPPVHGTPLFGYLAIALLLIGALTILPAALAAVLRAIPDPTRSAPACLAVQQLRATPRFAGISVAAILASVSLTVSMLIMIHSFRQSLEEWLHVILPADLYARADSRSGQGFGPATQARFEAVPGVARATFVRQRELQLDPARAPITLIARSLDPSKPEALPLIGRQRLAPDAVPVWISEAMRDRYGLALGDMLHLPLTDPPLETRVAGIWRDYARQGGAVLMTRADYVRHTSDVVIDSVWIWRAPDVEIESLTAAVRAALDSAADFELRTPAELRAASLAAFDRTFAVTYGLQIAAVLIGLFGISVGFGAQAEARRAEYGMLRHIGMTRSQITRMFACEGALLGSSGALAGLIVGALISLILIHVVNRQSFHWSMEWYVPWASLAALVAALIACALISAAISARHATRQDAIHAVRADW